MLTIPIQDTHNQKFSTILADQYCKVNLYQKKTGLYCDLYVDDVLLLGGVVCQNLNRIVRDAHLGFIGDLFFYDTQGTDDPTTPGLGTRFLFFYLEVTDA